MSKFIHISPDKEQVDSAALIKLIQEDGWIKSSPTIVNCFPEYSSSLVQLLNHKLSHLNKNELFDILTLDMPYPNMSQVYNSKSGVYESFDRYLVDWVRENITSRINFLFVYSKVITGRNLSKLKVALRPHIEPNQVRFASLYMHDYSIFKPDFVVEQFSKDKGTVLFHWENSNNKNWKY